LSKCYMTGIKNGKWDYIPLDGRFIDKAKFEEWKTKFYRFEGWDPNSGWPTRSTLESFNLLHVADELEKHSRLGTEVSQQT
jgi:aldehyde:ferredoxin oxidoreductase